MLTVLELDLIICIKFPFQIKHQGRNSQEWRLYIVLCLHLLLNDPIAICLHRNKGFDKLFDFLCVGDVYISVVDRGGQIEVEITQARGLTPKPGSKTIPGNPRLNTTVQNHFIHITF